MRSHVKSPEYSSAVLECGALQETGPHGADHREQSEGQRLSPSSLTPFYSMSLLFCRAGSARSSRSSGKCLNSSVYASCRYVNLSSVGFTSFDQNTLKLWKWRLQLFCFYAVRDLMSAVSRQKGNKCLYCILLVVQLHSCLYICGY